MGKLIAFFVALVLSTAVFAQQAPSTVTNMPFASVPLSGNELLYVVQNGNPRKTTVGSLPFPAIANIFTTPQTITAPWTFNAGIILNGAQFSNGPLANGADNTATLNALFAYSVSAKAKVYLPGGAYYSATGVLIPSGADVEGLGWSANNGLTTGPVISCPASLAGACVTVQNARSGTGATVRGITSAFTGSPVSGDRTWLIEGFGNTLENLNAENTYDGYYFDLGIHTEGYNLHTYGVTHDHIVQGDYPEVYIFGGRFGGPASVPSNAYIGITSKDPNTLTATGAHFNSGVNVSYFMDFFNLTSQVNGIYKIVNSHIEDITVSLINTDGTGRCLRCNFNNNSINAGQGTMFTWPSGGGYVTDSTFQSNILNFNNITIPSNVYVGSLTISNNTGTVGSFVNISAQGSADGNFNNMVGFVNGNVSFSGTWDQLNVSNIHYAGTYANSAVVSGPSANSFPSLQITTVNTAGPFPQWTNLFQSDYRLICDNLAPNTNGGTVQLLFGQGAVTAFTGSISGAILSTSPVVTNLQIGSTLAGAGVTAGTILGANLGSGTYAVSASQTVASTAITTAVTWEVSNYKWSSPGFNSSGESANSSSISDTGITLINANANNSGADGLSINFVLHGFNYTNVAAHKRVDGVYSYLGLDNNFYNKTIGGTYNGDTNQITGVEIVETGGVMYKGQCTLTVIR